MRFGMNDNDTQTHTGPSNFQYTGVRFERLKNAGYTLVCILVDTTGSTMGYVNDFHNLILKVIGACRVHPMKESLLIRVCEFNSAVGVKEIHGFIPVINTKDSDYPKLVAQGATPLYDAMYSAVGSIDDYARQLTDKEYNVNGVAFTITDGGNTHSAVGLKDVAALMTGAVSGEHLESFRHILIAAGAEVSHLASDAKLAGAEYVPIGAADEKTLAKLADFISGSISATSQSLGTGGPSQPLTF